jgi:hypothetical protein
LVWPSETKSPESVQSNFWEIDCHWKKEELLKIIIEFLVLSYSAIHQKRESRAGWDGCGKGKEMRQMAIFAWGKIFHSPFPCDSKWGPFLGEKYNRNIRALNMQNADKLGRKKTFEEDNYGKGIIPLLSPNLA